ncbi:MAG: TonB C-terminal domain-containing protein [Deltaproteobacteria bacterium]|nr:TonB C-terminal domain-containing protein [Deltaproteobacteria bacterium]MCL5277676.1 TonB C-terminal domain-containing protein [Deltaproteobacteria bacterium]
MKKALDNYDYIGSPYSSFYKVVAVSACAHVLFVAVILYGNILPSRTIDYSPAYMVRLVSAVSPPEEEKVSGAPSESKAPAAPPVAPRPAERMVLPVRKARPNRKEMLWAIKHIESELRKRELFNAIQETIKRAGRPASKSATAGGSGSGTSSVPPSGPAAQEYYSLIWERVQSEWIIPPDMADASYGYETVVDITLNRNGTVSSIGIEKSSGNVYFDQTAIRAIKKASPLPPFPPSWLQNSVDIGIKFSCKEGCK